MGCRTVVTNLFGQADSSNVADSIFVDVVKAPTYTNQPTIQNMAVSPTTMFTSDRAKAALKDMVEAFSLPDNVARLNEAKSNAGNDMLMYMQLVFPLATQIQIEVIQNYGFTADREGLLQFTHAIQQLMKENTEVSEMNDDLKHLLLPPLSLPYAQVSSS